MSNYNYSIYGVFLSSFQALGFQLTRLLDGMGTQCVGKYHRRTGDYS